MGPLMVALTATHVAALWLHIRCWMMENIAFGS
jgi:hypothetical protein